jgi:TatD DNase family protein
MAESQVDVSLPDPGAPVADTHAHLDMLEDPAGALTRAARARVGYVVTVVDASETPEATLAALPDWIAQAAGSLKEMEPGAEPPVVRALLGVHPHSAKEYDSALESLIATLASDDRVCGIGEIGLDYHYDYSPREAQRAAFAAQLRLEGPETAERFLELGCHISFAGPVTFKKAEAIRKAARLVPLDRLLVETDAPFMSPEPYRGRKNEPAWCVLTAARIAEEKGLSPGVVSAAVLENARRLFGTG